MTAKHPQPLCFAECAELLRTVALSTGTEMHVMVCPDVVVVGTYEPFISTCPHGVRWLAEPTGEQIAAWVEAKAP